MCTTYIIILNSSQNGKKNLWMWGRFIVILFFVYGADRVQIRKMDLYYPHICTSNPKKMNILMKQRAVVL
jgi:hypothetical protein